METSRGAAAAATRGVRQGAAPTRETRARASPRSVSQVLGRRLTLKQTADLPTKTWCEAEAARLKRVQQKLLGELRAYFRRVDSSRTGRGDAAAATWIFRRGDESRRRRGRDADFLWRPGARLRYGQEVGGLPSGKHACGFDGGRLRRAGPDRAPNASESLRRIMRDNDFLRRKLTAYRPVVGEV